MRGFWTRKALVKGRRGGVVSVAVVEEFDEVKQIRLGLFAGGENAAMDQIDFEGTCSLQPARARRKTRRFHSLVIQATENTTNSGTP